MASQEGPPHAAAGEARPRAPRRPGFIDWAKSRSKQIIMDDLIDGTLPLDGRQCPAKQAWERYKNMPEFVAERVLFDQFQARLADHRQQVNKKRKFSNKQHAAYLEHIEKYPRQTHNTRGELVFDVHPAKLLLREDIKNNLHELMTAKELQATRPEYTGFKAKKFRERIQQEIRYQKFIFWLNLDRANKERLKRGRQTPSNNNDNNDDEGNNNGDDEMDET